MTLDLERPLLLLLLPLSLAVVYWLWRTSRAYMPPLRRKVALGMRLAVTTLIVVMLAEPAMQLRADNVSVAFLVDRSASISPDAQQAQEEWLQKALATKALGDRSAIITFGETAVVEQALTADTSLPQLGPSGNNVGGTRSNLAAAIRTGVAALPPNTARRLIVLSDGRENLEKAEDAAGLAAAAGVQILSVPIEPIPGTEVLVRQIDAPAQLREGERFNVTAQIDANVPAMAELHMLVDGRLLATESVVLNSGVNRFILNLEPLEAGHHELRLQIVPELDTVSRNNGAGALTVVSGPASVLIVEGAEGDGELLAEALRASGLKVDMTRPSSAPLEISLLRSYASVVLANVSASDLGPGQMQAVKTYVQSFGGGLVVAGGERAFGPGGYSRTPLEEMLPVRMDLRGKAVSTSVALMLVIDTSGSMSGGPGGASKMDLAKEAAIAASDLLGEYDQIGIVAFEDTPRWALEPSFAIDRGLIQGAIGQMQAGGGTEIFGALKMGFEGLAPIDAKVKHMILLTDGQAPQGDYPTLTDQMRRANISLSTIAIGGDADFTLLENLANLGHGRYYEGNNPFDLPRLVVKETQQVQRAAIVEGDFTPRATGLAAAAFEGVDLTGMPQLRGYVATTAKPQTNQILITRELDPLLTEWQFGLGRVMSWNSDVRNRWASRWLEWPEFSKFWGQAVRRTTRQPEDPNRQVTVRLEGNQARITVDAQTGPESPERKYLNFQQTAVTLVGPRGVEEQVTLPQTAPGRYEALVPVQDDGVYLLEAIQTDEAAAVATQSGGFVVPYSPEFRTTGVDLPLLELIAKRTGGRILRDPAGTFLHDLPAIGAAQPLWPWLLVLTALLFTVDVAVRRVRITGPELRGAYYAFRRRLGFQDELEPVAPQPAFVRAAATAPVVVPGMVGTRRVAPVISPASQHPEVNRSGRLLAAKQRAARR